MCKFDTTTYIVTHDNAWFHLYVKGNFFTSGLLKTILLKQESFCEFRFAFYFWSALYVEKKIIYLRVHCLEPLMDFHFKWRINWGKCFIFWVGNTNYQLNRDGWGGQIFVYLFMCIFIFNNCNSGLLICLPISVHIDLSCNLNCNDDVELWGL